MKYDVICFCHLRWNFVYQRPQHLLTRFARYNRVFVVEEPIYGSHENRLDVRWIENQQIWIAVPHLRNDLNEEQEFDLQRRFLEEMISTYHISNYITWYYSPMFFSFTNHLQPAIIVYDCMDELSAFKNAPPKLVLQEKELFKNADIVFTGGHNLYKAKRKEHSNIYPMPSSIDKMHFSQARLDNREPDDQAGIPYPHIGFYGVIDERLNLQLVSEMADMRPHWHFVFLGPVVKIDPESLPRQRNIHYLGAKDYAELPIYLSGWEVAMMPFALNDSTKYISPTKTPEYLSGGKQVVSTSIADVVEPYGNEGLVYIADTSETFVHAIEAALNNINDEQWLEDVDNFLSGNSWDKTWKTMMHLISLTISSKYPSQKKEDVRA